MPALRQFARASSKAFELTRVEVAVFPPYSAATSIRTSLRRMRPGTIGAS